MADYKIANIKWLRDQGWDISSSYASGLCPTYNAIKNDIPKGSITVNVSGTCVATSKAYSNNQLVCEDDIKIITVDCSKYEVTPYGPGTGITDNSGCGGRQPNIYAATSALTLSYGSNETPNWMYLSGIEAFPGDVGKYMYFVEWVESSSGYRSGTPIFKSSDGCKMSGQTITQYTTCDGGGGGGGGGGDTGQTTTSVWFEGVSTGGYPTDYARKLRVVYEDSTTSTGGVDLNQQSDSGRLINYWEALGSTNVDMTTFTLKMINLGECNCQNISYTTRQEGGKTIVKVSFDPSSCF